jgi:hypothetical protein
MGFAWEPSNATDSGAPEPFDYPPSSRRHRQPHRRPGPGAAGHAHGAVIAIAAASRRARALISIRPALADHRRAF